MCAREKNAVENKRNGILPQKAIILNSLSSHFINNTERNVDKMQCLNTTCLSVPLKWDHAVPSSLNMIILTVFKKYLVNLCLGGGGHQRWSKSYHRHLMCHLCQVKLSDFNFCYCNSGLFLHFGDILSLLALSPCCLTVFFLLSATSHLVTLMSLTNCLHTTIRGLKVFVCLFVLSYKV